MEVITQSQNTNKLTIFTKTLILSLSNVEQCRTEVLGIVELEHRQLEIDTDQKELVELVKCARVAIADGDDIGRNRIIEVIFRRTQTANENWALHVLNGVHLPSEERNLLAHDLYADLCERVIRALMDMKRLFWEENFQHCLLYERKHVYQAFMTREGRWHSQHADGVVTRRIPRVIIDSLDQPLLRANGELRELEIEDELAQQALLSVEQSDLSLLILQLPEKLKSVIWLIFWESRTEKDAAQILGVSDRTVRNRLREALKSLRAILDPEGNTIYG
jgi:RNA polymerase sigma factor (sigma-70 family)